MPESPRKRASRLRLPELVSSGSADATVAENIVWALVRESSIKSRRAPDVTVAGLATLPRQRSLPALDLSGGGGGGGNSTALVASSTDEVATKAADSQKAGSTGGGSASSHAREMRRKKAEEAALAQKEANAQKKSAASKKGGFGAAVPLGQSAVHLSDEAAQIIRRQMDEMATEKALQLRLKNLTKPSSENWIPEISRMKSLERDLLVAKENLADIQLREMGEAREMKQFRVTELERALKAESLGKMARQSCGCCMLTFLPINLPLKVSQKAILDIRVKWSGGLNSGTVFAVPGQPMLQITQDGEAAGSAAAAAAAATEGGGETAVVVAPVSKTQKSFIDKMAERLSVVPRCYDEVPVCTFCAQFFQEAERYRPSYDKIYFEERKAAFMETQARNRLYWDPLFMVEKDRLEEEEAAAANGGESLGGGSSRTADLGSAT